MGITRCHPWKKRGLAIGDALTAKNGVNIGLWINEASKLWIDATSLGNTFSDYIRWESSKKFEVDDASAIIGVKGFSSSTSIFRAPSTLGSDPAHPNRLSIKRMYMDFVIGAGENRLSNMGYGNGTLVQAEEGRWGIDADGMYVYFNGAKRHFSLGYLTSKITIALSGGTGTVTPADGTTYTPPTTLETLSVTPDPYFIFDHYHIETIHPQDGSIAYDDANNPATLLMDRDYIVTAVLAPANYVIIHSAPNGSTNPPAGSYAYAQGGTNVTITSVPDPTFSLDHWVVDGVDVYGDPLIVTVYYADIDVTPVFV